MEATAEQTDAKPDSEARASKAKATKPDPQANAKNELKSLPMEEAEKKLHSTPDGLSQDEAKKRLAEDGPNELTVKQDNPLLKFLTYFWGPIPWMIEAAVILSGIVRHWPDFFIILVLLLSNAVDWLLGRTSSWQRDCRPEEKAGKHSQGKTRWQVDRPARA